MNVIEHDKRNLIAYVVGDFIIDQWQEVIVKKIAPDAPAPVWETTGDLRSAPGGAGNVAVQFRHLAKDVTYCGFMGISRDALVPCKTFTKVAGKYGRMKKKRFVSAGHVLARLDSSDSVDISYPERLDRAKTVLQMIREDLEERKVQNGKTPDGKHVVAVLSDYALGFWSWQIAIPAVALFKSHGVTVIVDAKPGGVEVRQWQGCDVIKLNESEAIKITSADRPEPAALEIHAVTHAKVVITRSGRPPIFAAYRSDNPSKLGECRESYSTNRPLWASGAGDCFTAHLAARIATGKPEDFADHVEFAHAAGAAYVEKTHNEPVHPREAMAKLDATGAKIYTNPRELAERISVLPYGAKIGYTNGCFDLLHPGHIACLQWARKRCDFLAVFVNSDSSIHSLKGDNPILFSGDRILTLATLSCVDAVIGFNELTPEKIFEAVGRCDILVKGEEYKGKEIAGSQFAEQVLFAPELVKIHTKDIVKRVQDREEVEPNSRAWEG